MRPILIGADPEFVVGSSNGFLIRGDYILGGFGRVGTDTLAHTMELRPPPHVNTLKVLANIRQLLRFMVGEAPVLKQLKFVGGSAAPFENANNRIPIGGHIHIGRTDKKNWFRQIYSNGYSRNPLEPDGEVLLETLVDLIPKGLTAAVYDREHAQERRKCGYGRARDYREGHSSAIFELRCPPSWLVSPTLAFAYLTMAKLGALIALNFRDLTTPLNQFKYRGRRRLRYIVDMINGVPELLAEEDIAMFTDLLKDIKMKKNQFNANWTGDFKVAWGV